MEPLAWISASVLDRVTKNAKIIWSIVALARLLVSMVPVFQLDLADTTMIWQVLLHLVFGLVLIVGYWLTWPSESALV